jgi:hypothetical protein
VYSVPFQGENTLAGIKFQQFTEPRIQSQNRIKHESKLKTWPDYTVMQKGKKS